MGKRQAKKIANRQKIIDAFSDLASRKSYFDVTIGDIARKAGISPSSFYTYYESKHDLLLNYMDNSITELEGIIRNSTEKMKDPSSIIRHLIYTLSTLYNNQQLRGFYRTLRELEFVDIQIATKYYTKILELIMETIDYPLLKNEIKPTLTLTIIGCSQFIHLFRDVFHLPGNKLLDIEVAGDLLLKGLSTNDHKKDLSTVQRIGNQEAGEIEVLAERYNLYEEVAKDKSKQKLLKSSLNLLSTKNFREIKVYEITENAGYAVGMFYKIYENKNKLLEDLIKIMSKTLRRYLKECSSEAPTPLEKELIGMKCFLKFAAKNAKIYKIVRESEYIDPQIAVSYYKPLLDRYIKRLSKERSRILTYNPESLAISLIGINHVAGIMGPILNIFTIDDIITNMTKLLPYGLLRNGLIA